MSNYQLEPKVTPKLSIYKASAGSGKTFRLTGEYLKLIFNPNNSFKSILAVTFTNKATAEMRERILKELHTIATSNKSDHASDLKKEFKLSDKELNLKAKDLLNQILHNYSRFNINTIDSFFQKILRAFTHETGLTSGFNVELNLKQILLLSIEQFFDKANNNADTKKWLSNFAIQKIEDGKSWDIEKDIYSFSMDAFNEVFFSFSEMQLEELSKIENFKSYKKELNKHLTFFIETLHKFGKETALHLNKHNLGMTDFSYGKSGVVGYMLKLERIYQDDIKKPTTRAVSALNSTDGTTGWCAKKSPKQTEIQECVNTGLQDILKRTFTFFEENYETYSTARAIYKGIDLFAVLVEVFNELNLYCREKNIFLLPLASPLLSKMIGSDDAPFIYEKTGENLKYFMIDEFQDTSKLQWNNFSPLFTNSISQGYESMVVGDVKQSIYRWRNGDWTLLNHQLADTFKNFGVKEEPLTFNWRSAPTVINFNNTIFNSISAHAIEYLNSNDIPEQIAEKFNQTIHSIYSSANQEIPEKNIGISGMVNVQFLEEGKDKIENTQWYLDKMIEALDELFEKKIQPKDIAVLVRKGKEGSMVAKHLMEHIQKHPEKAHLFNFVSNDSVLLGSSSIVLLLIALLEYLANPDNNQSKATIIYFNSLLQNNPIESAKELLKIDFRGQNQFLDALPDDFGKELNSLKKIPLSALVNRLLSIFIYENKSIDISKQLPFIHTFQDSILNHTKNSGNDILGFLDWWNEYGINYPVNLSDEQNAIKIITIHKSKGLEYNAVIIPFAQWDLDQMSKYMWCETPDAFNQLSMVPIKYSSELANTTFKYDYLTEKTMSLIDNLNLLYVALTRAVKALYIFAPKPSKVDKYKKVSDLLFNIFINEPTFTDGWSLDELTYRNGDLHTESLDELIVSRPNTKLPKLSNSENKLGLRLSAKKYFVNDEGEPSQVINMGNIYHKVMEHIITINDIETAVNSVIGEGLLSKSEGKELIPKLKNILASQQVESWFNSSYKIMNESSIITEGGTLKRPDRVMIGDDKIIVVDYKFTLQKSKKHIQQVKEYMNYIESIEKMNTIGYVWYVLENEIIKI